MVSKRSKVITTEGIQLSEADPGQLHRNPQAEESADHSEDYCSTKNQCQRSAGGQAGTLTYTRAVHRLKRCRIIGPLTKMK